MTVVLSTIILLLATLRVTRFFTADTLGQWLVVDPAQAWAGENAWRKKLVSGLSCPFCVGFWISVGAIGVLCLAGGPADPADWWWFGASAFALSYLVGHISSRLD
jgi:hypothetical protein